MGVILARILAELVLIVFRINEHLGAIRNQTAGVAAQSMTAPVSWRTGSA